MITGKIMIDKLVKKVVEDEGIVPNMENYLVQILKGGLGWASDG